MAARSRPPRHAAGAHLVLEVKNIGGRDLRVEVVFVRRELIHHVVARPAAQLLQHITIVHDAAVVAVTLVRRPKS